MSASIDHGKMQNLIMIQCIFEVLNERDVDFKRGLLPKNCHAYQTMMAIGTVVQCHRPKHTNILSQLTRGRFIISLLMNLRLVYV